MIDSSALVELVAQTEPAPAVAQAVGDADMVAPDVVNPEVLSALRRMERTGTLTARRGVQAVDDPDPAMPAGHRRTGSCFDNAAAESFWAVLKEEIGTRFWPDRATARADIFDFIETFYNRRRLRKHIHWGYLTPHETRLPR